MNAIGLTWLELENSSVGMRKREREKINKMHSLIKSFFFFFQAFPVWFVCWKKYGCRHHTPTTSRHFLVRNNKNWLQLKVPNLITVANATCWKPDFITGAPTHQPIFLTLVIYLSAGFPPLLLKNLPVSFALPSDNLRTGFQWNVSLTYCEIERYQKKNKKIKTIYLRINENRNEMNTLEQDKLLFALPLLLLLCAEFIRPR